MWGICYTKREVGKNSRIPEKGPLSEKSREKILKTGAKKNTSKWENGRKKSRVWN